jgi:hypothetical protein
MDQANLQLTQDRFSGVYPATIASAATVAPVTAVNYVTGTEQLATIQPPVRAPHFLVLIFTDEAPGALLTTGNIGLAVTPLPNAAMILQYEPRLNKYWPTGTGDSVINVPAGADGDVQFNTADEFAADADLNFDGTSLTVPGDTLLLSTAITLTDGAAAGGGTLLNAPTAGNPTKWIAIDDAGTLRYIPTWPGA